MPSVRPAKAVDFGPGSMGCHEVLHMTSFLCSAVDDALCEHPAIQANEKWAAMAGQACRLLADLYQAIGTEHLGGKS